MVLAESAAADILTPDNAQSWRTQEHTPPHTCRSLWIDRFFEVIRQLDVSQISREFVAANIIGSGHEGKVLVALRFLGLIDDDGNVTPRLRALRVVGPEFTTNLAIVVQQAYSEMLGTIAIKSASFNRVINFLMQRYSMTQTQANEATRFFVHLARLSSMDLSEELSEGLVSKQTTPEKLPPGSRPNPAKGKVGLEKPRTEKNALAVVDGPFGQIRVTDRPTLELARKLLDIIEDQLNAKPTQ